MWSSFRPRPPSALRLHDARPNRHPRPHPNPKGTGGDLGESPRCRRYLRSRIAPRHRTLPELTGFRGAHRGNERGGHPRRPCWSTSSKGAGRQGNRSSPKKRTSRFCKLAGSRFCKLAGATSCQTRLAKKEIPTHAHTSSKVNLHFYSKAPKGSSAHSQCFQSGASLRASEGPLDMFEE